LNNTNLNRFLYSHKLFPVVSFLLILPLVYFDEGSNSMEGLFSPENIPALFLYFGLFYFIQMLFFWGMFWISSSSARSAVSSFLLLTLIASVYFYLSH